MRTVLGGASVVAVLALALLATQALRYPDAAWPLAIPQLGLPPLAAGPDPDGGGAAPATRTAPAAGSALDDALQHQAPGAGIAGRPAPAARHAVRNSRRPEKPAGPQRAASTASNASKSSAAAARARPEQGPLPRFAGLTPFSPQTRYMSLPAYVRFLVHAQTGRWITYGEAIRILRAEGVSIDAMGR